MNPEPKSQLSTWGLLALEIVARLLLRMPFQLLSLVYWCLLAVLVEYLLLFLLPK